MRRERRCCRAAFLPVCCGRIQRSERDETRASLSAVGNFGDDYEAWDGRSSGAAVYYHGLILYYGGECKDAKARIAYDEFDAYDPKTNSWKALAKAPSALHAQAGAVVGDTAYFIGGSSSCGSDKPSLPVYAFRLP